MSAPAPAPTLSLIADLRALPRAFWILFAGTFINRFGTFVWPFLTIYLTRQGYSLGTVSVAVSGFGVGALLGSTLGGWLSDHIGRRHTIVLGTFLHAGFVMLLYVASGLPALALCTACTGMASGMYHPAANALLTDLVPVSQRLRAFAAIRLAHNAGFACGAATGGVLANYSLFWLFAGDALTSLAFGGIAFAWLPHGLRRQTQHEPWREAIAHIYRDRAFRALWLASFCAALIFAQFASTYSLQIMRAGLTCRWFGVTLGPETVFGVLIGWNGVLVVLTELPLTSLTRLYAPRHVMALGNVLLGIGFAMNGFAPSILALGLAMTVFTAGEILSAPTTSAYVSHLAPERLRGRYMGTLALAWNSAGIAGPLIGFWLFAIDPMLVWVGCGLLGFLAAGVIWRIDQRVPDVPSPRSLETNAT